MRHLLLPALIAIALAGGGPPPAQAAGCIKGAAVGGVAGHVAGHHALLGAAVGCAIGHHEAAKAARARAARPIPPTGDAHPPQTP